MFESKKDKIKDYIIAILLAVIAILAGFIFSKYLIDKNMADRDKTKSTTKKAIHNYFSNLEADGYVLNDFSTSSNFDYNLGKINLFKKDYEITIENNYYECNPECNYMYKVGINNKEIYKSSFLAGIKIGVIGNYVAIQEIYHNGANKLILYRPNDAYIIESLNFKGSLNITYNEGTYVINVLEQNCSTLKYQNTKVTYNKENDEFLTESIPTDEVVKDSIC